MARFIRRFSTKIRESHGSENSPRDRLLFTSTPPPPSPTSDESSGELIIQPRELTTAGGLPLPTYHPFPRPRVAFNTLHFIKQLEAAEFNRSLATEMMHATRNLLVMREERASRELLSRQDLDNEAYLFVAALSELKTESQVKSRNDGIALRSMTSALDRETDAVTQKLREDMLGLKSDIQLDMNSRKEETSTDLKALDMSIMELNNKFTILLGEVRTEVEATKWISTRRVMGAIVAVVVVVIAFVSAPTRFSEPHDPLSVEDLGIRADSREAEMRV